MKIIGYGTEEAVAATAKAVQGGTRRVANIHGMHAYNTVEFRNGSFICIANLLHFYGPLRFQFFANKGRAHNETFMKISVVRACYAAHKYVPICHLMFDKGCRYRILTVSSRRTSNCSLITFSIFVCKYFELK